MKIFQTLVFIKTAIRFYDTIFWNEKYWIVPRWLENKTLGIRKPKRVILLDDLAHEEASPEVSHHFVLKETIPIYILHGHIPKETKVHVIENPEVELDIREFP